MKELSGNEMLSFSEMEAVEENLEFVPEKVIQNELQFTLTEDSLNMRRSATNKTL